MGAEDRTEQERRRAWQVAVAMFAAGAVTMVAILPAPDPDTSDRPMFVVLAAVFAVVGLILWRVGPRRWVPEISVVAGLAAIGVLVAISRPLGPTPFFYLWPILHAGYFLPRRRFVAAELLLAVTYGVALAGFAPPGLRMTYWVAGVIITAVAGGVVNHQREQLETVVSDLRASAATDPLTGLLNRRAFADAFARELARAGRDGSELVLAIFDIDHFKTVNDRYGHAQGDEALRRVAGILSSNMRDGDVVARMGGEEFAVLFARTGGITAHEIAERISREVTQQTATDEAAGLTMSVGLAERGLSGASEDDLMRAADVALYEAKDGGRNRVSSYTGSFIRPAGD